jgi:nucleoside-diphosphate-sugar epimerase
MGTDAHAARHAGTVAVTGATGFVGPAVVRRLVADGWRVRILARRESSAASLPTEAIDIVAGDVTDPAALARLVEGADAVVHLATATSASESDPSAIFRINVGGALALVQACRSRKDPQTLRHLVVTSTHTVHLDRPGDYVRAKLIADHVFVDSGLPVTILRLNIVYGRGTRGLFPRLVDMIRRAPFIPIIGDGSTVVRPVLLEDVADTIRACLVTDTAIGKIYDVGGADEVSYEEFHVRIMNVLGRSKKRLHIPWSLALALARGFEAILPRPPLTRDNVYYFVPWPPCNLGPIRRELGIEPTRLDVGLRRALEAPA